MQCLYTKPGAQHLQPLATELAHHSPAQHQHSTAPAQHSTVQSRYLPPLHLCNCVEDDPAPLHPPPACRCPFLFSPSDTPSYPPHPAASEVAGWASYCLSSRVSTLIQLNCARLARYDRSDAATLHIFLPHFPSSFHPRYTLLPPALSALAAQTRHLCFCIKTNTLTLFSLGLAFVFKGLAS